MAADQPERPPFSSSVIGVDQAASLLREAGSVLILTHRNPDGDAIGSATALRSALRALGKDVQIVCPDPLPAPLLAVPDALAVAANLPERSWELIVTVDL